MTAGPDVLSHAPEWFARAVATPYMESSVTPYISSKRSHCSRVSGAVLQVISRRLGTSLAL